jgi:hypothetical protein
MVQIGLKVGALDALRLREHFGSKCMPLGIVNGGCGTQISADLVFLQIQPRGPLIGVDRSGTPMSRRKLLSIRSGNRAERSGIAVRPLTRLPLLTSFDHQNGGGEGT